MCTILTIDKAFFAEHSADVLSTLRMDSIGNRDGYGLVTMGQTSEDAVVIKSKSVDAIITSLSILDWERAWVHCRASTSSNDTLADCHPFVAFDAANLAWYVMHNGILSGFGSSNLRVDSKLITQIIGDYGVSAALGHLMEHQSFANVFIVCPETGEWHMSRCAHGRLHTDGKGNYSTNPVGTASTAVPADTTAHYRELLVSWDCPPVTKQEAGLPAELKARASDFLVENYGEINTEWDRYVDAKYGFRHGN